MALSNYDRVGKGLELLRDGLVPFAERELESKYGDDWRSKLAAKPRYPDIREDAPWDIHALLVVIWNEWQAVFGKTLGHFERALVSELRDVRNKWAHQEQFSTDDAHRA